MTPPSPGCSLSKIVITPPTSTHMSTQARQIIADRRAEYFSDFTPEDPGEDLNVSGDTSSDGSEEVSSSSVLRKPSYVGLSHAVNGYTPYSQYKARLKKISPPLQIPVSPPSTLDSVGLVISQDSYHRSVSEFEAVMRDLSNMGRPQRNTDMIDCAAPSHRHLISNGDGYYPKTHSRQLIGEGETQSVEIVTKFHSDEDHSPTYNNSNNSSNSSRASPSKQQNLVQKQIERLYGDTHNHQVRMTSPEPDSVNQSPAEKTPERKISGGFFAKRFGIIKMKDHSSKKLLETSEGESSPGSDYKPLKVPAVFRLLRPEFREQLKQSSCKIEIPHEKNKQQQERIIPIRREGDTVENGESSSTTPERTVPIVTSQNGHHNNNNNKSPPSNSSERVIPIRRESGDINNTPKRPAGFAPKVNGFSNGQSKSVVNGSSNGHSDKAELSSNGKQNIVRKLSPLSPKHIVVPSSAEKPAPMPKPDHLKSPPMSPEPASSPAVTPPLVTSDTPVVTEPVVPAPAVSPCPVPPTQDTSPSSASLEHDQCGVTSAQVTSVPTSHTTLLNNINNNHNNHSKPAEQQPLDESYEDYDNPEEYPEEFYYENPRVPSCGLRERELLCPIMEEDNESTASGSIMNLANTNNPVIGKKYFSNKYFSILFFTPNIFPLAMQTQLHPSDLN